MEEIGGWISVAGLAITPFTGPLGLKVAAIGGAISLTGAVGNIIIDAYEENYKAAGYRAAKTLTTQFIGKGIDRIPGVRHALDKTILRSALWFNDQVFTRTAEPIIFQKINQK